MKNLHPDHPHWAPPHCPNDDCPSNTDSDTEWRFKRNGKKVRVSDGLRYQQFTCKICGVYFSSRTFCGDYWLKRRDAYKQIMTLSANGMCNRQIARHLKVSPSTVDRHVERIGRQCLLFHAEVMKDYTPPKTIVVDGFQTYELSKYFPCDFNVAVAKDEGFFLWFTDSPLRRSGKHTEYQKKRRAELEAKFGRPDPQAVRKDMQELLEVVALGGRGIQLISDEHLSYPPAVRAVNQMSVAMHGIKAIVHHERIPSKLFRDRNNKMWEVNLLDGLIRHSEANHKRKTWASAKRRNMAALRLVIYLVCRNYLWPRWAKSCKKTPAMFMGLMDRALEVEEILGQRLFIGKVGLKGRWAEYYWGEVETPALGVNRRHSLKKAA